MSSEANETRKPEAASAEAAVAKQAPTEQQESKRGTPKRLAVGQTVCNEKNEKGKLCNGHLKEVHTAGEATKYLRGDDVLHQCQTCGTLYAGPPLGHVRDTSKQRRYVEKDLAAILRAAGGTLPAYDYPIPEWRGPQPARLPKAAKAPAASTATPAPEGETPEQKKARLVAEHKAKLAAKSAPAAAAEADSTTGGTATQPATSPAPTAEATADSSPAADLHRPAAEAQAATGAASAAPLSPAASTASPAAGAESLSDLSTEASTELTPGAPRDERPAAAPSSTAAPSESAAPTAAEAPKPKPKRIASAGAGGLPPIAPHLAPPPGETPEQKRERLRLVVEEAKRKAGKL